MVAIAGADRAYGIESAFLYYSGADAAHGLEAAAPVRVRAKDSARAADKAANSWPSSRDSGRARDRTFNAWPSGADAGHADGQPGRFRFSLADFVHGIEVLHEMGIWTYIPVNVRLQGRFWRVTGRDSQGREVVLLQAEQLSGEVLRLAEQEQLGRVRWIGSADCAGCADAVSREPVAVTCWVQSAVQVTCWLQPAVSVSVSVSVQSQVEVSWPG